MTDILKTPSDNYLFSKDNNLLTQTYYDRNYELYDNRHLKFANDVSDGYFGYGNHSLVDIGTGVRSKAGFIGDESQYMEYCGIFVDSSHRVYFGNRNVGDGSIYYNGYSAPNLFRISQVGEFDVSFNRNLGSGAFISDQLTSVKCITQDASGNLYVGGRFITFNGLAAQSIVKLHIDGTRDQSFYLSANTRGLSSVAEIEKIICSGNKILLTGNNTNYGPANYKALLLKLTNSGLPDATFTTYSEGFNERRGTNIVLDNNGKIYLVRRGFNNGPNGYDTYKTVLRFNTNGTLDTAFDCSSFGYGGNGDVRGLKALYYDSTIDKIYVGGQFNRIGDVSIALLARINNDGTVDTAFDNQIYGTHVRDITKIDNHIYVVGNFLSTFGEATNCIVALTDDSSIYKGAIFGTGFSDYHYVECFAYDSSLLFCYGSFHRYKKSPILMNMVAVLDASGNNMTKTDGSINLQYNIT